MANAVPRDGRWGWGLLGTRRDDGIYEQEARAKETYFWAPPNKNTRLCSNTKRIRVQCVVVVSREGEDASVL